jgi:RNA polymerase sigma-70 factor (ECF subfamily)
VLSAREPDSPAATAALETLCRLYWYPLYAYVRRLGHGPHDAQDLTQEFFARLLSRDYLRDADRLKGRFRSFLMVAFRRFLANEWDRSRARKRGGGQQVLPLEVLESRYQFEPADGSSPDRIFERRWALTLIERGVRRLRDEFEAGGRLAEFERFKGTLTAGHGEVCYITLAEATGQSPAAVRVAVHRFRRRFREIFREEVHQTVAGPDEVAAEMRHLLEALST